jgi:hypothetical protein
MLIHFTHTINSISKKDANVRKNLKFPCNICVYKDLRIDKLSCVRDVEGLYWEHFPQQ